MSKHDNITQSMMAALRYKLGDQLEKYTIPPPVFVDMQGEFVDFDLENEALTVRFPLLERYLNPYGSMQGGMIAAAVDNTLGPLSVLVAPPNVTRHLELTYSKPIRMDMEFIIVNARFLQREESNLIFRAEVRSPVGERLARAKAVHRILV